MLIWNLRIISVGVSLVLIWAVCHFVRWQERPDPETGVALELSPTYQVINQHERPNLAVRVKNRGSRQVVLVEPGDGSESAWRTPIIEWMQFSDVRGGRCGNRNGVRAEEVFILKPGETRKLSDWVTGALVLLPGRNRIAVRYTNRPDLQWIGLADDNEITRERIRQSTAVSTVSNSVVVVVN